MIPMLVILRVRGRHSFGLWLPLVLVWLLLLPISLALLPFVLLALAIARINPWRTIDAFWGVLTSFSGTHVEVATADYAVFVHVY